MRFAALETSTDWCSVALWRDGEISALERRAENRHGEFVLPMLERLLQQAGTSAGALDGVAFGSGPGSFTGLRIACGAAQGLAFAHELPVVGVTSFEQIADEAGAPRVVACLDARMGEVYYSTMLRAKKGRGLSNLHRWDASEPVCAAPGALPVPEGDGWIGCGSAFLVYREALRARLGAALADTPRPEIRPGAAAVARIASFRFAAGETLDAAAAAPLYLRDRVAMTTQERGNR